MNEYKLIVEQIKKLVLQNDSESLDSKQEVNSVQENNDSIILDINSLDAFLDYFKEINYQWFPNSSFWKDIIKQKKKSDKNDSKGIEDCQKYSEQMFDEEIVSQETEWKQRLSSHIDTHPVNWLPEILYQMDNVPKIRTTFQDFFNEFEIAILPFQDKIKILDTGKIDQDILDRFLTDLFEVDTDTYEEEEIEKLLKKFLDKPLRKLLPKQINLVKKEVKDNFMVSQFYNRIKYQLKGAEIIQILKTKFFNESQFRFYFADLFEDDSMDIESSMDIDYDTDIDLEEANQLIDNIQLEELQDEYKFYLQEFPLILSNISKEDLLNMDFLDEKLRQIYQLQDHIFPIFETFRVWFNLLENYQEYLRFLPQRNDTQDTILKKLSPIIKTNEEKFSKTFSEFCDITDLEVKTFSIYVENLHFDIPKLIKKHQDVFKHILNDFVFMDKFLKKENFHLSGINHSDLFYENTLTIPKEVISAQVYQILNQHRENLQITDEALTLLHQLGEQEIKTYFDSKYRYH